MRMLVEAIVDDLLLKSHLLQTCLNQSSAIPSLYVFL